MKVSVRTISVILLLMLALTCFAGCTWGGAISAEHTDIGISEDIIRGAQETFPGCEYVRTDGTNHIFVTPEGIEFHIFRTVINYNGHRRNMLCSNYFSSIVSHHNEEILSMNTESVKTDRMFSYDDIPYGDIVIRFDGRDAISEAAEIFCRIDDLCRFEAMDQHAESAVNGKPAVSASRILVVFFCKDPATGEYDQISCAMGLSCNSEERADRADMVKWLTEQYEKEFADSENTNQA